MRRIGSNIRKQNTDERANRLPKNIIKYTEEEKPKNEYPKRIVSPPRSKACCTDENRTVVGQVKEGATVKLDGTDRSLHARSVRASEPGHWPGLTNADRTWSRTHFASAATRLVVISRG